MYIKIGKKQLEEILSVAGKALPARAVMPVLEGIKLSAKENTVTAEATNTATRIAASADADVIEQGAVVLDGKLFTDIVDNLPEGQVTVNTDSQNNVIMTAGLSEITLISLPAKDFPPAPVIDAGAEFTIPADTLKAMIKGTVPFAEHEPSTREMLTGVSVQLDGETLTLTAIDGYRIAQRHGRVSSVSTGYNGKVVIPAKSLAILAKILPADDTEVKISLGDKFAEFNVADGKAVLTAALLNGRYFDYKVLIEEAENSRKCRLTMFTEDLKLAVDRAVTVAQAGNSTLLKLAVENNYLMLNTAVDIAKASDKIAVDGEGEDVRVGLNGKYLADVLSVIQDEQIVLSFGSEAEPIMAQPVEGKGDFLYYILPIRLS
jgi:DNA polymerase-3 subunit beta